MGEAPTAERARLLTAANSDGEWAPNRGLPRVTWNDVAELSGGLLALSGCPQGELARRVRSGNGIGAREFLDFLREVFPGCLAVEVWDHALPEERALADRLLELADEQGLPAVATNDVHYARPSGRIVHDVLTCLRHQVTLDEAGTRLRPNGEWHLKPPSVVWRRWRHRPDVVENTLALRRRLRLPAGRPVAGDAGVPGAARGHAPGVPGEAGLARCAGAVRRGGPAA